jgi:hypothetical protein
MDENKYSIKHTQTKISLSKLKHTNTLACKIKIVEAHTEVNQGINER